MTDRHTGYLVTLEGPIREDDAEAVINAIKLIKGVVHVEPIVDNYERQLAKRQAKSELIERMWMVLVEK